MGTVSIWHWLIVFLLIAGYIVPSWIILRRLGFSGWWALLAAIPLLVMIGLWVLALRRWPIADANEGPIVGFRS
jgi:hypothetical protein